MKFWQVVSFSEPDQLLDIARAAEEAGFEGVLLSDHLFFPGELRTKYPYSEDGKPMFDTVMHPTGLSRDGVSTVYKRFEVKAGTYRLAVKMNDNLGNPGFNFVKESEITLKPAQILVVDFNPDRGGLFFK